MTKQQDADGHPSICRNYFRYRSPGGLHPQRPAPTVRGCRGSGHSVSLCQARCSDCQETSGKVACVKLNDYWNLFFSQGIWTSSRTKFPINDICGFTFNFCLSLCQRLQVKSHVINTCQLKKTPKQTPPFLEHFITFNNLNNTDCTLLPTSSHLFSSNKHHSW